jgi:hypothetical protein
MFVTGMMGRGIILEALFPIALTFRSLDEGWFRATLVPKAELSFRTPRRWRVQGALPKGRKVLECGAPAPLFKAPSRDEQAKTKRKGAARETATKIPLARDSRRGAESAEKKFCQKCRLLRHCTAEKDCMADLPSCSFSAIWNLTQILSAAFWVQSEGTL